ncbi:MAG TPA: OB-fold nucleic acid binding domain-containing protein, partial [Allosphingosinicella sp.]|nr:OB-fold nucleic acid binding domain-containing protein [Allosphingosinicella sp.]
DFAERTFKQIEGFGSYGFPESHAASFAKIAYASSWMKCHHPDVFAAALLNAQPMGFYAPAQIVRDAREHGVEVRPVCVANSGWDCTLEDFPSPGFPGEGDQTKFGGRGPSTVLRTVPLPSKSRGGNLIPLRLGLRQVKGLSEEDAESILAARAQAPFTSIEDVWRRSGVPRAALERLADADAFHGFGLSRRQALWQVRGLGAAPLPLFAAADARETVLTREPRVALTPMTEGREVVEDYRSVQLSLRAHPLAFLRPMLEARGILPCGALHGIRDGRKVGVAGIVLVRQRPGAGNVTFVTIEDETGIANVIIWQRGFEAQRRIVLSAAMIGVKGTLQREGEVIHVIADRLEDLTLLLHSVGARDFPHRTAPGDGAVHGGAPDPRERKPRPSDRLGKGKLPTIPIRSRDFH